MRRRAVLAGGGAALLAPAAAANGEAEMTAAETEAALAGTWAVDWVRDAAIPAGLVPLLEFRPGQLGVFAGCNGYSLSVQVVTAGKLMLGPAQLNTRASCGEAAAAVEAQVLRALQRIEGAAFPAEGRLVLSAFGTVMIEAGRRA